MFHFRSTSPNFKVSNEEPLNVPQKAMDFTPVVHINTTKAMLKYVLYSTRVPVDLLLLPQFSSGWLRDGAGCVASMVF